LIFGGLVADWDVRLEPAAGDAVRIGIENRIVDVLDDCPNLRRQESRNLLLDAVRRAGGERVQLPDYPTARQWFVGLVLETCRRQPCDVAVLVAAVSRLESRSPTSMKLARLGDEWEAADVLPADLWPLLRAELGAVRRADVLDAYRSALGGHASPEPPPHCETGWDVLTRLTGANAPPRRPLPPYMAFLEHSDAWLRPATAQRVHQWNLRAAYRWKITGSLDAVRLAGSSPCKGPDMVYLLIQIDQDGMDAGRYLMSWCRRWETPIPRWEPGGDRTLRRSQLADGVEEVVGELERELADLDVAVGIEFVLPLRLLNTPVEWWYKDSSARPPKALAMDYPVVLRSLERMHDRRWHRVWRRRWARMTGEPASVGLHWSRPAGDDYCTRLESRLTADEGVVALVLSEPPGPRSAVGRFEVTVALRAGIPVIVWHRSDCSDPSFTRLLEAAASDGGLRELRERARAVRLDALAHEPETRKSHVGTHLAILWDDPGRLPGMGGAAGSPDAREGGVRR
jgi:hypothetical protein